MRSKALVAGLMVVFLLSGGWFAWRAFFPGGNVGSQRLITVAEDTTWIVEPLDEEGFVDYVSAINRRLAEGIEADENAMVLYARVVGPDPGHIDATRHAQFFAALGIDPPSRDERFVAPEELVGQEIAGDVIRRSFRESQQRPWTSDEFPWLVEWLEANEQAFATAHAATLRPKFYLAQLSAEGDRHLYVSISLSYLVPFNRLSQYLRCRAMWRAGHGDVEGAFDDLFACVRVGRHLRQAFSLLEGFIGNAIEGMAVRSMIVIAQSTAIDRPLAADLRRQLDSLPPRQALDVVLDQGERPYMLAYVQALARGDVTIGPVYGDGMEAAFERYAERYYLRGVAWDRLFRMLNEWYDRSVHAARRPTYREVHEAVEQLERQLGSQHTYADEPTPLDRAFDRLRRRDITQQLADELGYEIVSRGGSAAYVDYRTRNHLELARLAIGLSSYRAEHGHYPERLEALVPVHLPEEPWDVFADRALRYYREGDGYVAYSVGPGGFNDGRAELAPNLDEGIGIRSAAERDE